MLESCPQCGYSLKGLPVEYKCPECGLAYDRQTHIFRETARVQSARRLVGLQLMDPFLIVLFYCWIMAGWSGVSHGLVGIILAMMAIGSGRAAWSQIRSKRLGVFVATLPAGLLIHRHLQPPQMIPWTNMKRLEENKWGIGANFRIKSPLGLVYLRGVFVNRQDVEWFLRIARDRMKRAKVGQEELSGGDGSTKRDAGAVPHTTDPKPVRQSAVDDSLAMTLELRQYRPRECDLVGLALSLVAALLLATLVAIGVPRHFLIVPFALGVVGWVRAIVMSYQGALPQKAFVSSRCGVTIMRGDSPLVDLGWEGIGRATYTKAFGVFRIESPGGDWRFQSPYHLLGNWRQVVRLTGAINEARKDNAEKVASP